MVKDSLDNIRRYYGLVDKLDSFREEDIPAFYGFIEDREYPRLFIVRRGSAVFATSWRENPLSREATGAITASEGEFVLYLPGEPILVKTAEDSSVSMCILR